MNPYEMTFIIRPDLDDEQTRAVADQVTRRLTGAGGEIIALYPWSPARRRMAYPIGNFGDGFYATTTFRLDPQALREVENAFKLNESILRFLIVQASDQAIRQAQQRMQQQAAAAAAPPSSPTQAPVGGPQAPPSVGPVPQSPAAPAGPETAGQLEAVEEVAQAQGQPEPLATASSQPTAVQPEE